jgi:hypothetical protein
VHPTLGENDGEPEQRRRKRMAEPLDTSDAGRANRAADNNAANRGAENDGVLTVVCLTCGTEYYYSEAGPPAGISCAKCGNTVFRSFFTAVGDEVADDFKDSTDRALHTDDAEGETMPGDVLDLKRE